MQIQVNTDNHTSGSAELAHSVQKQIADGLQRFASRITRVEVQLTDQNSSAKSGPDDQRCLMEVRIAGLQPISVSDRAPSQELAIRGAIRKMQNLIESKLGKLGSR